MLTIPYTLLKDFSFFISKSYGIHFDNILLNFVQEQINARMFELKISSPEEYFSLIKTSKKELTNLVDSLTINVTSFFRIFKHFELLKDVLFPEIEKNYSSTKHLKIWSAGCSNGSEPYSIAMETAEYFKRKSWDIQIIASDISWKNLLVARKGIYSNNFLKDIPSYYSTKYCKSYDSSHFEIDTSIKKMITWEYSNLLYNNSLSEFNIIFCRNVLYYFQPLTQNKVVTSFYKKLNSNSTLVLGASEHITAASTNLFNTQQHNGIYFYKKT